MKALSVQQPFAYEILVGQKTIEVRTWDTLHRGDLLICSSGKPAFSKEDMEEIEDEYGCTFLYGYALCVVRIADVRLMQKGDEERALADQIDPESYSWVIEDVRPVLPFPVKGRQGLFDVDDGLITLSPFQYNEPVVIKDGTIDDEFGVDFSGWHGRTADIQIVEEDEPRITVIWDSVSLKAIPVEVLERCEKEGIDWTAALLRLEEIESTEPRDTWEDVQEAIESIMEANPALFEE
jgi:hypothetical protein